MNTDEIIYKYEFPTMEGRWNSQNNHNKQNGIINKYNFDLQIYNYKHDIWECYVPLQLNYMKIAPSPNGYTNKKYSGDGYITRIQDVIYTFTNSELFPETDVIKKPSDYKQFYELMENDKYQKDLFKLTYYGIYYKTSYNEYVKNNIIKVKSNNGCSLSPIENHYWIKKNDVKIELCN